MRCFEAGPEGLEYVGFGTHTENDTATRPGLVVRLAGKHDLGAQPAAVGQRQLAA